MQDARPSEYEGERDDQRFWAEAAPAREPGTQRWFVPTILLALAGSVPWYWSGEPPQWFGLPVWVWITIGCSTVVSALTAHAAVFHWSDDEDDDRRGNHSARGDHSARGARGDENSRADDDEPRDRHRGS